jgi:antitoxin component HigA of HigAB toxin-antitoxin module
VLLARTIKTTDEYEVVILNVSKVIEDNPEDPFENGAELESLKNPDIPGDKK